MCRMAFEQGTRAIAATAHLHERWPKSTPSSIIEGTARLAAALKQIGLPLSVYPSAEVAIRPDLDAAWQRGAILGVGGRVNYVLIEIPMDRYVDTRDTVVRFMALGVRPILAHPERYPELLHRPGAIETLIEAGALVQVTASSLGGPPPSAPPVLPSPGPSRLSPDFLRPPPSALRPPPSALNALRRWVERGVVHLVGSDGHSPDRRPPEMASAYRQIAAWSGQQAADRLCSLNGLAILEGRSLRLPPPRPEGKGWLRKLMGQRKSGER